MGTGGPTVVGPLHLNQSIQLATIKAMRNELITSVAQAGTLVPSTSLVFSTQVKLNNCHKYEINATIKAPRKLLVVYQATKRYHFKRSKNKQNKLVEE